MAQGELGVRDRQRRLSRLDLLGPGVSVDIVVSSLTSFEDGEIDHAVDRARQTPPAYLDL